MTEQRAVIANRCKYLFITFFLLTANLFAASQLDIMGPAGSERFGTTTAVLPNGNIVITDPFYDAPGGLFNVGAVYVYNGATNTQLSVITGSTVNDQIGLGGITVLPNGNFVFVSQNWNNGAANAAGAVTWCDDTSGCSGTVSAANSIVGGTAGNNIGNNGITVFSNGNYVIKSATWDNGAATNAGAMTFCNGTMSCAGVVSAANSLVGSTANDLSISSIVEQGGGYYTVHSSFWDNGAATNAGAITFCSDTTGCAGFVSASTSIVGSSANDNVGGGNVTLLGGGKFLVSNTSWDNGVAINAGAVTFCNAAVGCAGAVSAANSLIGSTSSDNVGANVVLLGNGNYVIRTINWDNGAVVNAGAVTFCNGTTGCTGTVSAANSLVGTTASDGLGGSFVTALPNGNYVVGSTFWDNGATANVGAATFCNGTTGCVGTVSAANSRIGSTANDNVGFGITVLSNGNYVLRNNNWDNGAVVNAGAVSFCSGTTGCTGTVSAANSLVGSTAGDFVGDVTALPNGNYVVRSVLRDNGAAVDAGAITFCNAASGCVGTISSANSLVGTTTNDQVGNNGITVLTNGNYVVSSNSWKNGAITNAGAVTWCSGTAGCVGAVSAANSLVGSTANDFVGTQVRTLPNGNYITSSGSWNNGAATSAGHITWCNGNGGTVGTVNAGNSLVGTTANDQIGNGIFTILPNSNYVAANIYWQNGGVFNSGAVTFGNGNGGTVGAVSAANSLVGSTAEDRIGGNVQTFPNGDYLVGTDSWDNGALINAGHVTWCSGTTGCAGAVSASNSIVGSTAIDIIGAAVIVGNNYYLLNPNWDNGATVNAGAVTIGAGNGGTVGTINADNSVRGLVTNSVVSAPIYNSIHESWVVKRPLENIVSIFKPTFTAVSDGAWTSGATWDYGAFTQPQDVYIPNGRTVNLDIIDTITSLRIDCTGALSNTSSAAYIIGTVRKDFCSTSGFTYPVGTANGYSPVNANITALGVNPSSLSISATENVHPSLNPANSLKRFWTLNEIGDLTTDVTFNYLDPTDITTAESSYRLFRVISNVPTPVAFSLNSNANTVSATNVSSFSDWVVGNPVVTAADTFIAGKVKTAEGNGIRNATVVLTDANGNSRTVNTGSFGNYRFDNVAVGETYTVTVIGKRYAFTNAVQVVTVSGNIADLDFTAVN